jgi:hypothetical protein
MTWYEQTNSGAVSGTNFDREIVLMVAPDGTQVLVQDITATDAPIGTPPTIRAWNLDGSTYTGLLTDLKCCPNESVKIISTDYCSNNLNFTRLDAIAISSGLILWTQWLNNEGVLVDPPSGPQHSTVGGWTGGVGQPLTVSIGSDITKGVCSLIKSKKLYFKENDTIITLSSILITLPVNSVIESISISQELGVGSITGDSGSSIIMQTGRTVSFGIEEVGSFNGSLLQMDAGLGGVQRITIIYSN